MFSNLHISCDPLYESCLPNWIHNTLYIYIYILSSITIPKLDRWRQFSMVFHTHSTMTSRFFKKCKSLAATALWQTTVFCKFHWLKENTYKHAKHYSHTVCGRKIKFANLIVRPHMTAHTHTMYQLHDSVTFSHNSCFYKVFLVLLDQEAPAHRSTELLLDFIKIIISSIVI